MQAVWCHARVHIHDDAAGAAAQKPRHRPYWEDGDSLHCSDRDLPEDPEWLQDDRIPLTHKKLHPVFEGFPIARFSYPRFGRCIAGPIPHKSCTASACSG